MITIFEAYENKPDVNSLSPEFWQMVRIANWKSVFKGRYRNNTDFYEKIQKRVYLKYDFDEIIKFKKEYQIFYDQLHKYFRSTWLNKKYREVMPSDDGYSDLLSSIIGRGKIFTKKCINDKDVMIEMSRNNEYAENFGYILQVGEKGYWKIKEKFDPFWSDIKSFNL